MKNNFTIPMSKPNFGIEEKEAIIKVLDSNWPSQGKITEEFEELLSEYLNSECIVVNNGSSALMAILLAYGIKSGDKVVVPDFTFVATSSIPKILGAEILVADVDPLTFNVSIESIETLVKQNDVKFVFTVDIGGLPSDIERLRDLAKRYNFVLIEDAAQSFGAEYKNKKLGSFEHLTSFSFQIAKQISTIEGGCIASTDSSLLKKIRQIKDYGRSRTEQYVHDVIGTNFRTTDLQSAIGIQQLKKIDKHIEQRTIIANEYKKNIKGIQFQKIPEYATRHSHMLFFGLTNNHNQREIIINHLNGHGIDARKIWTPIHMQPCNQELNKIQCKNTQQIFERAFTLPIYNDMKIEDSNTVINLFDEND
jgi:perosamine synthetase